MGHLASSGISYRTVNLPRSAISFQHHYINNKPIAEHLLIRTLLKAVRVSIPPSPKYTQLWDINSVLEFFTNWLDNSSLSLKQLSAKLTIILSLISCKKVSDVKALDLSNRMFTSQGVLFNIVQRTKTKLSSVEYPSFPINPKLCVVLCLQEYEKCTGAFRTSPAQLLISFVKPHPPVSSATLARWVKWVMGLAGIDVSFWAHSAGGAMASKAYWSGARLEDILKTADWSSDSPFFKNFLLQTDYKCG